MKGFPGDATYKRTIDLLQYNVVLVIVGTTRGISTETVFG